MRKDASVSIVRALILNLIHMDNITFRVHGYWLGPITTVWDTKTPEQFEAYCKSQGFEKNREGVYQTGYNSSGHRTYLEIQK